MGVAVTSLELTLVYEACRRVEQHQMGESLGRNGSPPGGVEARKRVAARALAKTGQSTVDVRAERQYTAARGTGIGEHRERALASTVERDP